MVLSVVFQFCLYMYYSGFFHIPPKCYWFFVRSSDLRRPLAKSLDSNRQALQAARDELQKGIDKYQENLDYKSFGCNTVYYPIIRFYVEYALFTDLFLIIPRPGGQSQSADGTGRASLGRL